MGSHGGAGLVIMRRRWRRWRRVLVPLSHAPLAEGRRIVAGS